MEKNKYQNELDKFEGKIVEVETFSLSKVRGTCIAISKDHLNIILESEEKDDTSKKFIKTITLFKNIQSIKRNKEEK
jgi:small nuclear ribonucleoprotein (snRNP)-like protein